MWNLPRPGLEPTSPALAGGFLTTVPPGKSLVFFFFMIALAIQHLLWFHKNFRIFVFPMENAVGILIGILLNL